MSAVDARSFLGASCSAERPSSLAGQACGEPASYLVLDGECPLLACARHLLDTIEEVVGTSYLTVDSEPLGVIRLREDEGD